MPTLTIPDKDWLAQHQGFLSDYTRERVTQRIAELLKLGKLPDNWIKSLEPLADKLIMKSCLILFPDWKNEQERQELDRFFDEFAEAIAYLAFCPGGIKIFGTEYLAYFE